MTTPVTTLPTTLPPIIGSGGGSPVWRDEGTGHEVEVTNQLYPILSVAIENGTYEYITDGSSVFINPNTYYYYIGNDPKTIIDDSLCKATGVPLNSKVNRIYQLYPFKRFLMLTNRFYAGTLNPITTRPAPLELPYPTITTINEALKENNKDLYDQRYNIIDTQDTLNTLTNRLNKLKLKISNITRKAEYSASGKLTFY